MKPNDRLAGDVAAPFRTTHWILLSAQTQVPSSRTVPADFCHFYWPPVYVFVCRFRKPHDELLRDEVARTASESVDEEIRCFAEALVALVD
jgi:hypothetical protein